MLTAIKTFCLPFFLFFCFFYYYFSSLINIKIIYGIIYGIAPKTLANFLNSSEADASSFIESFKSTFPGLQKFISSQIDNCRIKGYIETIRKRRRNLPLIASDTLKKRSHVSCFIIMIYFK